MYRSLNAYYSEKFGCKVYKLALDAGFTCPNIDGTRGCGGCIYCDGGSGYFTAEGTVPIGEQFRREEQRIRAKFPQARIVAYFQAHSNTYTDTETLSRMLSEAVGCGAYGISVATRADCIDEDKAALLASQPVPVTVELGLQTAHDVTAERINRCHSFEEFLCGYSMLKAAGIRVCVHIINGLPSETEEMMLKTAEALGKLRPDGVKIHLMHVIEGTQLAEMYKRGEYVPLEKQQYIDIVIKQLELLPPDTVIERITGDGDKKTLLAPLWSMDKISVLGGIDKRMAELSTWQGKRFTDNVI